MVNSINAINEQGKQESLDKRIIKIEITSDRIFLSESDANTVRGFKVTDNGVGLNERKVKGRCMI